jgi:hypothetical protein
VKPAGRPVEHGAEIVVRTAITGADSPPVRSGDQQEDRSGTAEVVRRERDQVSATVLLLVALWEPGVARWLATAPI